MFPRWVPAGIKGRIAVSLYHPVCPPVLQGLSSVAICKGKIEPLFIAGAPVAPPTATLMEQIAAYRQNATLSFVVAFPTGTAGRNPFLLRAKCCVRTRRGFYSILGSDLFLPL